MENGIVVEIQNNRILVEAEPNSCCDGCSAGSSCALGAGGRKRRIWMDNTLGALAGDEVVFIIEEKAVMAGALLMYLLPVVSLLAGIVYGSVGPEWPSIGRELLSILWGCAGLVFSFAVMGFVASLLKKKKLFLPRLVDITRRQG
jgi:sigma-E factor negative regulatory protein RseC